MKFLPLYCAGVAIALIMTLALTACSSRQDTEINGPGFQVRTKSRTTDPEVVEAQAAVIIAKADAASARAALADARKAPVITQPPATLLPPPAAAPPH